MYMEHAESTWPTQPLILSGSINWAVSNFIGCVLVRHLVSVHEVKPVWLSTAVCCVWQQFSRVKPFCI